MAIPITEEQWKAVEERLSDFMFGEVTFKLAEDIILVRKAIGETKNWLDVWINGKFKGSWNKDNKPVITKVFKKKFFWKYTPKMRKELEKIWGKRELKKRYPDLLDRGSYYSPCFSKGSVLVRQYKKIKDLELVKIGC